MLYRVSYNLDEPTINLQFIRQRKLVRALKGKAYFPYTTHCYYRAKAGYLLYLQPHDVETGPINFSEMEPPKAKRVLQEMVEVLRRVNYLEFAYWTTHRNLMGIERHSSRVVITPLAINVMCRVEENCYALTPTPLPDYRPTDSCKVKVLGHKEFHMLTAKKM